MKKTLLIPVQFQDVDSETRVEGAERIGILEHPESPQFSKTVTLKEDGYRFTRHILKCQKGFLLVEVAVALLIIGLLVGGVLKAQELLESSRLQATINNLESYRVAVQLFQERYNALPGDFSEASQYIDSTLQNGNGNGIIDGDCADHSSEASQFWEHLSKAGFIQGSSTHDKEKIGGKVTVRYNPDSDLPGHWFLLGNPHGQNNNGAVLTPVQARTFLQKMGGSDPNVGHVRIKDGSDVEGGSCLRNGSFNGATKKPACVVYVAV